MFRELTCHCGVGALTDDYSAASATTPTRTAVGAEPPPAVARHNVSTMTPPPPRNPKNLPTKLCPVCKREFTWRKKWERDWGRVVYCSERCRRQGRGSSTLS